MQTAPHRTQAHGIYVASRASIPARSEMWRALRAQGCPIVSTWIDEAGEGQTASFPELWERIEREIDACVSLVLYVEPDDFPLKGALIEVGMALGRGKPVAVVLGRGLVLAPRSSRPLGSWVAHPLCSLHDTIEGALQHIMQHRTKLD